MRGLVIALGVALTCASCSDECFIDGFQCSHDLKFRAIAAGTHHTCALRLDGSVACWGRDDDGEASPPAGTFDRVFAGDGFSCAHSYSGALACWGDPAVVSGAPLRIRELAVGRRHACGAAEEDASVHCWGENGFRQLDVPATLSTEATSTVQFGSGRDFTCARAALVGPFQCWGRNDAGQLAIPPVIDRAVTGADRFGCGFVADTFALACWGEAPSEPASFDSTLLTAGATHICGLSPEGSVACWGDATAGQTTPPSGRFKELSAGATHTCAVTWEGRAVCWGDDADGESSPPTE